MEPDIRFLRVETNSLLTISTMLWKGHVQRATERSAIVSKISANAWARAKESRKTARWMNGVAVPFTAIK